jgi:glutathione synthase/RimK-type ligase-like ATP-grasp enzyme
MARWALIATPDDKRARGFCAALARLGEPPATVIPWPTVISDPAQAMRPLADGTILRIDSPGMDEAALAALVTCGGGHYTGGYRDGVWQPGAARFRGLTQVLTALAGIVAARAMPVMADPEDILLMSDKARCRAHLAAAGIAIAPGLEEFQLVDDLHAAMERSGWSRVFVKPRWGSSGAGIIAYQRAGARVRATTTLRGMPDGRVLVSKRLQHLDDPGAIHDLLTQVLADGAVVERWIPKLATAGGPTDLRVVVIGGTPRHRIARVGAGAITNLHLDAHRLEVDALFAGIPARRQDAVWDLARRTAATFPRSWHLGIDLLLTHRAHTVLVGEVNAWGDLLPGLQHEGEDTYSAEIRTFLAAHPTIPCGVSA